MAGFTDYFENYVMDSVFTQSSAFVAPTLWTALFTAAPTDASSGTEVTSTGGYTRIKSTGFSAPSSGYVYNSTAIAFPVATDPWGTVEYFSLCTSSAAGSIIAYSSLTTSRAIVLGDTVTFSTGAMAISLD